MITFTKEFMYKNRECYSVEQLENCSFMKQDEITLISIIESEISLKDKFWFVCNKIATKEENQQIAIACAEAVLPIYEEKYPANKAPREAIEAAKLYITGSISIDELFIKRSSAIDAADNAKYSNSWCAAITITSLINRISNYITDTEYTVMLRAIDTAKDYPAIKERLLQILINYTHDNSTTSA